MRRVAIALGFLVPLLDQASDAFVFHVATPSPASTCREFAATSGGQAFGRSSCIQPCADAPAAQQTSGLYRRRYRGQGRAGAAGPPAFVSLQDGAGAAGSEGGPEEAYEGDEDAGMAPVDMDQAMGSFSPEWDNTTAREDPRKHLIKGSVIAANQTAFSYPIASFPPLANSEVYYNGTAGRFWWNQNADAVCVYVPVPKGFDPQLVEFVAKTKRVSLKLDGEEILSGTPFYRIDGYSSLFVVDCENDPPYVQLELFKVREFQNWEDLLLEHSTFTPGGAQ